MRKVITNFTIGLTAEECEKLDQVLDGVLPEMSYAKRVREFLGIGVPISVPRYERPPTMRELAALELRKKGMTLREIGEHIGGISASRASQILKVADMKLEKYAEKMLTEATSKEKD